jgi:hypothetical protein
MPSLDHAKTAFRAEKAKLSHALSTLAGSRWLTALIASLAMSFGVTLAYAPDRLPHLSGMSLTSFGLPDTLDFGAAGARAGEAAAAAQRQGAGEAIAAFLAEHAGVIPWINGAAFALCCALLLGNMWIMTERRRTTRG